MKMGLALLGLAAGLCAAPVADWERFEKQVRDGSLPKDSLKARFPAIYAAIRREVPARPAAPDTAWVFPVAGYSPADAGKGGFRPGIRYGGSDREGYDFFDGNRHGGHPAYDIFIRDRNHDCKDDRTGKPVAVVAPREMLVLSEETAWDRRSALRGGKYVWAWAPDPGLFLYFAHLDSIFAVPGAWVAAGKAFATVGRTGKNARMARSPTHLHFMVLRAEGDSPVPVDYLPYFGK